MNLRDSLRAAVSDPPPSQIDLDALSRKEHRQRRIQQFTWVGAGLSVVAVVAVIGALLAAPPQATPDSPPGAQPTATEKPVPTPTVRMASAEEEETAERLTALLADFGDLVVPPPPGTAFAFVPPGGWLAAPEGHYEATWTLGNEKLAIVVFRAPIPQEQGCTKNGPQISCERIENPDGSVTYLAEDLSGPTPVRRAEHYRPDNVAVIFSGTGIGGPPSVTFDDCVKIASYAVWAL